MNQGGGILMKEWGGWDVVECILCIY